MSLTIICFPAVVQEPKQAAGLFGLGGRRMQLVPEAGCTSGWVLPTLQTFLADPGPAAAVYASAAGHPYPPAEVWQAELEGGLLSPLSSLLHWRMM